MKSRVVYLAGFMGAGKSTIGPILANTLGWSFYDLDREIEKAEGKKVRLIFEQEGESYFREKEKTLLKELSNENNVIISLGGGTMLDEDNIRLMKNSGKIFYLRAGLDAIYKRLKYKRDRPALQINGFFPETKEDLLEVIKKLLNDREKFYLLSDHIILTDNIPVGKTVDKIARLISS